MLLVMLLVLIHSFQYEHVKKLLVLVVAGNASYTDVVPKRIAPPPWVKGQTFC